MSGVDENVGDLDIGPVGSDDFMPSQTGFLISAICRQERAFSWDAMIEEQLHADSSSVPPHQNKVSEYGTPKITDLMLPDDSMQLMGEGIARGVRTDAKKKSPSSLILNNRNGKGIANENGRSPKKHLQPFPDSMVDVFKPNSRSHYPSAVTSSSKTYAKSQDDDMLEQLHDIFCPSDPSNDKQNPQSMSGHDSSVVYGRNATAGMPGARASYAHDHAAYADMSASNRALVGGPAAGNLDAPSSSAAAAPVKRIGIYTLEERALKIKLFREKKEKQVWCKAVKYDCRKKLADTRPRIKGRFISRGGADANSSTPSVTDSGAISDGGIGGVTGVSKKANSVRTYPSTVSLNNLSTMKEDNDGLMDASQLLVNNGTSSSASPPRPATTTRKYEKSKYKSTKVKGMKQELMLYSSATATVPPVAESPLVRSSSAEGLSVGRKLNNSPFAAISPPISPTARGAKATHKKDKVSPGDLNLSTLTTRTSKDNLASDITLQSGIEPPSKLNKAMHGALGTIPVMLHSDAMADDVPEYDGFGYDFMGIDGVMDEEEMGLGLGIGEQDGLPLTMNLNDAVPDESSSTHARRSFRVNVRKHSQTAN